MKSSLLTLSIALAAAVSCTSPDTERNMLCSREFECHTEVSTKTSLGEDNRIIWDEDDHIKVFTGSGSQGTVFSDITISDNGRKAIFKGKTEMSEAYYAVYPAQDDSRFDPKARTVTVDIPSIQKATEGSFADNANPAIAKTGNSDLYFRNIGAILAIRCPTAYASSFKLCSRDRAISGSAVIGYDGEAPEIKGFNDGKDYIELEGLGSSSYGKTFYITAYPGDYQGFDITITNWARTHRCIIGTEEALHLERNDNILLYDGQFIGWNAPMPPSEVTAEAEKDGSVTVRWSCSSDESLCKGFRIIACESGSSEAEQTVIETSDMSGVFSLTALEEGLTYRIGVQSIGNERRYDSETVWAADLTMPESSLYEWEKKRTGILTFADLDLLPGGITRKSPETWNENRLKPHVTFTDGDGKEQWLHEAFLLIGSEDAEEDRILCIAEGQNRSGDQNTWKRFADYWLSSGGVIDALDRSISDAAPRIGSPGFRHKVVMTMPDPIMLEYFYNKKSSTAYWGKIDGRELDFSDTSDQVLACRWFIDYVRRSWDKAAPENLELAGFYILSEVLVARPDGWNYQYKKWDKILPEIADYLHEMKYGMYWIPYYQADGYDMTDELGIDYTWIQPNKYWDYPEKKQKKSWTWVFDTISAYGHGMEIEFEGSHGESGWSQYESGVERTSSSILETVRTDNDAQGTPKGSPNPHAARNKQLLRDYMSEFKKAGYYGKARIATYSGTDAMYELATSSDEKDKEMYLEYCRFIIDNPLRTNK